MTTEVAQASADSAMVDLQLSESTDHSEIASIPEETGVGLLEVPFELGFASGLECAGGAAVQTDHAEPEPAVLDTELVDVDLDTSDRVDQELAGLHVADLSTVLDRENFVGWEWEAEPKVPPDLVVGMVETAESAESETDWSELECCLEEELEDHSDHMDS
jgi:hypothetical protein